MGIKLQTETDYTKPDETLSFTRVYRSLGRLVSSSFRNLPTDRVGKNWTDTYQRFLEHVPSPATGVPGIVYAVRPDGSMRLFGFENNEWKPFADSPDKLHKLTDTSGVAIGWRYLSFEDDTEERYDNRGRLLSITARTGVTQTLYYSNASTATGIAPFAGLLIRVEDSFGKTLQFVYDAQGRISKLIDPAGGEYLYQYDGPSGPSGMNDLTSVTAPDGKVRVYHYNESAYMGGSSLPNALTGITDENGNRYAIYKYNSAGKAISTEHAGGAEKVTLSYPSSTTTTVTDALGTARTYGFQTILGVAKNTSISQPCTGCGGGSASITYDTNGNVASRTDFNGNRTNYTYDLRAYPNRLTRRLCYRLPMP